MGESLDDIIGISHFKELAEPLVQGLLKSDSSIQPWIRPAQFVSENMPLGELLPLMRRSGQAMVIVVDEFGGTAGLITLQDLAAEIIGESRELESPEEPDVHIVDEQTFLVQAQVDLEEVNDLLNLELPLSEEYQTLGGFIIYHLQKIPTVGEQFQYQDYEMTVESAEGPRLERIQIRRLEPEIGIGTIDFEPIDVDVDEANSADEAAFNSPEQPELEMIPDPWDSSSSGSDSSKNLPERNSFMPENRV
jgi:CBS domain containing-hemolysin-like protein